MLSAHHGHFLKLFILFTINALLHNNELFNYKDCLPKKHSPPEIYWLTAIWIFLLKIQSLLYIQFLVIVGVNIFYWTLPLTLFLLETGWKWFCFQFNESMSLKMLMASDTGNEYVSLRTVLFIASVMIPFRFYKYMMTTSSSADM